MLRMKVLLLLAATTTTVVLAGCNGVGEAENNNGAGTTPSVDTTPPSTPTGLTAAAAGSTGANLSWSASTDNVGGTSYIVRRHGVQVATPATTTTVVLAGCKGGGDAENNTGAGTTPPAAPPPPPPPTGLTAAAAGSTGANLSWSASPDNVGVPGYIARRNGVQVATPATTSFADTGLSAATTYSYTVAARDAAGNTSPDSASVSITIADTTPPTPPTPPTGLTAALAGSTRANLS